MQTRTKLKVYRPMNILKSHPKTISIITAGGSKETRCFCMFTVDPLPDVVFCITKAITDGKPLLYVVSHYASGTKIADLISDEKDYPALIRAALARLEKAGFDRVRMAVSEHPVLNHDEEDWLL